MPHCEKRSYLGEEKATAAMADEAQAVEAIGIL